MSTSAVHLAPDFARIFAGLPRVHGWYVPEGDPDAKGKVLGRRATSREPVTLELWERHLRGEDNFGIGITPIRDDSTCVFGAIDVDVYPVDYAAVLDAVDAFDLPLTVCRTKSGGVHLFLFLSEPVPAPRVRRALADWATALGYPTDVEIFPKQDRLAGPDDDAGCGSWINVPYNGGRRSNRYAFKRDAKAMTPDEFVAAVAERAVDRAFLDSFKPPRDPVIGDLFEDGPPCLVHLAREGFGDWQNNGMFNVGVYLKKRFGDLDRFHAYNEELMDPPLTAREASQMVASLGKKNYRYKCNDAPIKAVCNRAACLLRKHGVGGRGDDPGIVLGELTKHRTDPPTWIIDVNGSRVELTTKQLLDQRQFRERIVDEIDVLMTPIAANTWDQIVRGKLEAVTRVDVPDDARREGQLLVHLQRFCTSRVVGKNLDDLLRGVPYTDEKASRTYFCSSDFLTYLQQHRVNGVDEKALYRLLKPRDLEAHSKRVKGKPLTYWSVPAFQPQTEEHDVPRAAAPEKM